MADENTNQNPDSAQSTDAGQEELQAAFDEANKQGYFGETTDPTPDENYTLIGQGEGLPTPETDEALADEVAAHQREIARGRGAERSAPGRARAAERGSGRGRGANRGQ
jgi:hypothetical protein